MRIATACSGIGAAEQAAKRVWGEAYEFVFACEIDKFARESFAANYEFAPGTFHLNMDDNPLNLYKKSFPYTVKHYIEKHKNADEGTKRVLKFITLKAPKFKEFSHVLTDEFLERYRGIVDIFVAGTPCQNFSLAGLRQGLYGKTGILIWQFFRMVKVMRPRVFVWENVKGFVSDNKGKTLKDFLEVFRSIGYHCHYGIINTKDYDVPQNRERIFIIGFLDQEAYWRFEFAPKMPLTKTIKDVLEENVDEKYYIKKPIEAYVKNSQTNQVCEGDVFQTITAGDHGYSTGYVKIEKWVNKQVGSVLDDVAPTLRATGNKNIRKTPNIVECNRYEQNNFVKIRQKSQSGVRFKDECGTLSATGNRTDLTVVEPKILAMRGHNPENPTSRQSGLPTVQMLEENAQGICNALTTVQKDNLVQEVGYRIRKLTPRECLRLQDFPDSFKQVVSDSQMYKQAGNSKTVVVVEKTFWQIDKALKNKRDGQQSLFGVA